jgi:hypothetical protein
VSVIDAEYAGRHMDVVVVLGATRLHARIPTGDFGSWARRLRPGDRVTASFRPADAMVYAAGDETADVDAVGDALASDDMARSEPVEV